MVLIFKKVPSWINKAIIQQQVYILFRKSQSHSSASCTFKKEEKRSKTTTKENYLTLSLWQFYLDCRHTLVGLKQANLTAASEEGEVYNTSVESRVFFQCWFS